MPSAVIGTLMMLTLTVVMAGMVIKTGNDMAHAMQLQAEGNACIIRGQVIGNFTTYWNGAVCIEMEREDRNASSCPDSKTTDCEEGP